MASLKVCSVEGCDNKAHARGYCRKHYGQIWRKGKITSDAEGGAAVSRKSRDELERLKALERELRRAENMYDMVVGFEGRLKWRRELEAVKDEICKIDANYFADESTRSQKAEM
jgi:hypothetical protein